MSTIRIIIALFVTVLLAACTTSQTGNTTEKNIAISGVNVKLAPAVQAKVSPGFEAKLATRIKRYAAGYAASTPGKKAKYRLDVTVTKVNFENVVSGIIDNDRIYASSKLVDAATGKVFRSYDSVYVDPISAIASGVSGAVVAAATPQSKVEPRLTEGLADAVLKGAYLTKSTPTAVKSHVKK